MHHAVLASVVLAPMLAAQVSAGPFVGMPITFVVGGAPTSPNSYGPGGAVLSRNLSYAKTGGFVDLAATAAYAAPSPDFRFDAMFGATRPPQFRLDAMSSGFNYIWVDFTTGRALLTVPAGNRWGALLFSVTRGSSGGDAPVVASEAGRADGAGADVFSVVLPGSVLPSSLNCVPVGVVQRATDSAEMGFTLSGPGRPELGDFDPYFQLYDTSVATAGVLPANPWCYFSLPPMVAADPAVAGWFQVRGGVMLPVVTPSGATILRTRWDPMALAWSSPEVFLRFDELGLAGSDDIDALAVDENGTQPGFVLLSLTRGSGTGTLAEQLMVAQFTFGGPTGVTPLAVALPYEYDAVVDGLQPVAKLAGAGGGGDIDATCELDPANGIDALAWSFIRDCRSDLGFPTTMDAAVAASPASSSTLAGYAISVSGLQLTDQVAFYGLLLGFPGAQGAPVPVSSAVTYAVGAVTGSTLTLPWSLPRAPQGSVWDARLDFQWATLGANGVELARVARIKV